MLLRSSTRPFASERVTDIEKVRTIVEISRRTYANLAFLGDKNFLLSSSGRSFIMYAASGQNWIAMGDPVGPKQEWDDLIWWFHKNSDRHGCWPVFYGVDGENLHYYTDLGLAFLKIGEEACVPLKTFSIEGSKHRSLRYMCNKFEKSGCRFEVISRNEVAASIAQLKDVSDAWLKQKNAKEKGFSLGFFNEEYLKHFPAAIVRSGGKVVAFANLWSGAEKEELSIDLMRHLPDSPDGVMDYLFTQLMLWGRQEGYQWFNLGMAPLSGLDDRAMAKLWSQFGSFVFRHGGHFYNFQGLRKYKEKFKPEWHPKYLVCRGGFVLPRILRNILSLTSGGLVGAVSK
jgi:phosphatidylglycerol lysyltransferase